MKKAKDTRVDITVVQNSGGFGVNINGMKVAGGDGVFVAELQTTTGKCVEALEIKLADRSHNLLVSRDDNGWLTIWHADAEITKNDNGEWAGGIYALAYGALAIKLFGGYCGIRKGQKKLIEISIGTPGV